METSQKNNFVKLTTQGYPILLNHSEDEFYEIFQQFVNASDENNFYAELLEEGIAMHAGMRTEVCRVHYDTDRVLITSKISDKTEGSSMGEFSEEEEFSILGMACLGVLYFCDLYAISTGQEAKFGSSKGSTEDKEIDNNTKYKAWPV